MKTYTINSGQYYLTYAIDALIGNNPKDDNTSTTCLGLGDFSFTLALCANHKNSITRFSLN